MLVPQEASQGKAAFATEPTAAMPTRRIAHGFRDSLRGGCSDPLVDRQLLRQGPLVAGGCGR